MAITEEQRRRLFRAMEEVLGHEPTVTLMEHLPPVGWADVATRRDLAHQDVLLRGMIRQVELKIESSSDRLRAELARDLRSYGLAVITVNASITALAVGLGQLL